MELARTIVLDIAAVSQRVVNTATQYARRRGSRNVQSCHFRLEREMQKISVAAGGILNVLSESSLPNGPPLDDRLQEWFSTDELPACLDTLHQMERMLWDDTWMHTIFNLVNTLRALPPEDKISAALKLFDSRRNYFHFLLTTDVWNCEDAQQQSRAGLARAQEGPSVQWVLELDTDAMEIDEDDVNVPLSKTNRVTIREGKDTKQIDARGRIDDILKWLDGLSCAAKQEETLSLRQPDTCTWLHSTPEYLSWEKSDNSFLWLQGKPGSGKTVLASFIVDSLKEKRRDGEALAFFYCDFRNDRSTSATEVMRSILSQLLRHIRDENIDLGGLVDDLVREKNGDTPILTNVKHLATFVSRTAKQFRHEPLVVVDALDECKDIKKLLDGLLILTKGSIRLFVTSRPLQTIFDNLYGLPSLSVDQMASVVSTDIALHVTRELDSSPRLRALDPCLKMEIHSILCDRADGMFRWVQCQIDSLNRCATRAEVREALDNLPLGLDETYQRILVAIDTGSPEGKLALRALVWLVGALRPLRLVEILEGLTIDLGRRTMDPETGAMHKGVLLSACGSLVTYNEKTDILILSHFSVKEYLTGDPTRIKLPRYHISYQDAHENLARICVCYLTLYLKHVQGSDEDTALHRIMRIIGDRSRSTTREWPHISENSPTVFCVSQELLGYVFTDGFNHLGFLGPGNRAVLKDMLALQSDIQHHRVAWEKIRRTSQRYKAPIPWPAWEHDFMLYILTSFASDSLLRAFLGPTRRVLEPRHQTNPLVYAAYFGKPQHARLFLSRGAKVNERGLAIEAPHHVLPLEVAVSRQHDAMVDLLLSIGSIVPKQLFAFTTDRNFPVRIARRLLETDEFMEWVAEPGNRLPSPLGLLERRLSLVYERDIIIMIRRLVQVGLDPAARDSAQKTALHLAITGGYQAVVAYLLLIGTPLPEDFASPTSRITRSERASTIRFILDIGIDARVFGTGDTILHLVIKCLEQDECLKIVKILVGAGYKAFVYNDACKTPLHLALEQGYSSVADYLLSLQRPASPDLLSAVVESGCPTAWITGTLRTLISGGTDVRGATAYGSGLLHLAVKLLDEQQGLEIAKFLVDAGCDPFKCNVQGKTPLRFALDRRSPLLVECLLSTAKIPPLGDLFAILRSVLPADWRARTISSLVDRGADASGHLDDGNTLLHACVLSLDESQALGVAKLLVSAGCDPFKRNAQKKTTLNLVLDRKYSLFADYLLSIPGLPPPDSQFAILRSACPADWRTQTISSLVSRGANVSGYLADGSTLLHVCVLSLNESQALKVAKLLVGAGCDPFKCNRQKRTSFDLVVDRNYFPVADYLLSTAKRPPPDSMFSILRSAFSTVWKVQTVRSLIDKGADVHVLSTDGHTLLHATILTLDGSQALEVVELLVDAGCDPFKRNIQGNTSLDLALNRKSSLLADYLLSSVIHPPPDTLFSILQSALPVVWKVHTICSLVSRGVDASGLSVDGNTLLHATVLSLDDAHGLDVAKHLICAGCEPFRYDTHGRTPLHIALDHKFSLLADYLALSTGRSPSPDVLFAILRSTLPAAWRARTVSLLIGKGSDARWSLADRDTSLHIILLSLDKTMALEVCELLVNAGYDPFKRNVQGKTLLDLALDIKSSLLADLLLSTGRSPPSDVLFAILCSALPADWRAQIVRSLINRGADVRGLSVDGNTLLHTTLLSLGETQALEVAKVLVDAGCVPSIRNRRGETALHIAARKGFVSITRYILLLDHSLPDDILLCMLPLYDRDHMQIVHMLIRKGANTRFVAVDGNNLLHTVISPRTSVARNMQMLVKTLIDSGCDAFVSNSRGKTPLHLAVAAGYISIVESLLSTTTVPGLPADILACALGREAMYRSQKNTRDILQRLIDKGANVHFRAADGGTLLHMAIKNSPKPPQGRRIHPTVSTLSPQSHSVSSLIASHELSGAAVWIAGFEDSYRESNPRQAVSGGNTLLDVIKLLVNSGCDPLQCDRNGLPPSYFAQTKGYLDIVKYLPQGTVPLPQNLQVSRSQPRVRSESSSEMC